MFGSKDPSGKEYYWYRCNRRRMYHKGLDSNNCKEKGVCGDIIDEFAWNYVLHLMTNADAFEAALRDAQAHQRKSLEPKAEQLSILIEQIARTEKEASEIAEALKKVRPGGAVEKNLLADMERVDQLYEAQVQRRGELEADLSANILTDENADRIGVQNVFDLSVSRTR